ncbi:hypothetical protein ABEB36_013971 [Hypothenemus hampei]|uniref:Uncharacterized protein n=1 Tax=Hypothenemus hampei TaxID=57062 RepID=A0ABD1E7I6_HYPHA
MVGRLTTFSAFGTALFAVEKKRKTDQRMWIYPRVNERPNKGHFYILFVETRNDEHKFFNFTRMTIKFFDELLDYVKEKIIKKNTRMRTPIPPEEKLKNRCNFFFQMETIFYTGCFSSMPH